MCVWLCVCGAIMWHQHFFTWTDPNSRHIGSPGCCSVVTPIICMTSASDVSQFHEWSDNGIWIIATAIYWVILLMHYWLVDLHNSAWRRSCFNVFVVYCGDRTYWLWGLTVSTTAHEYRRSIIEPSSLNNKLCKSWAFTLKSPLFTESSALRIIGNSPRY